MMKYMRETAGEHAGKYPAEKCTFKENKNLRGRDSLRGLAYALAGVFIIIVLLFIISQVYFSAG